MKQLFVITLAGFLALTPAHADTGTGTDSDVNEGIDLLEKGARMFLRGLRDEMEPALRELAENMEPAMRKLLEIVDDFDAYHLPEVLPNGDIIIRRKTPLEQIPENGETEI